MTGGALATSLTQYVRTTRVSGLDDSSIHGILVKAQVGMCQLLAAWHASMAAAAPALTPASLTITTTKDARLARAELERMGGNMRIARDLATAVAGIPAASSPMAINAEGECFKYLKHSRVALIKQTATRQWRTPRAALQRTPHHAPSQNAMR